MCVCVCLFALVRLEQRITYTQTHTIYIYIQTHRQLPAKSICHAIECEIRCYMNRFSAHFDMSRFSPTHLNDDFSFKHRSYQITLAHTHSTSRVNTKLIASEAKLMAQSKRSKPLKSRIAHSLGSHIVQTCVFVQCRK